MANLIHPQLWSKDFDTVNVSGTRNLTKAAKINGIKKIIYVSSNSSIGCNINEHEPFTEDSVFNPIWDMVNQKWRLKKLFKIRELISQYFVPHGFMDHFNLIDKLYSLS